MPMVQNFRRVMRALVLHALITCAFGGLYKDPNIEGAYTLEQGSYFEMLNYMNAFNLKRDKIACGNENFRIAVFDAYGFYHMTEHPDLNVVNCVHINGDIKHPIDNLTTLRYCHSSGPSSEHMGPGYNYDHSEKQTTSAGALCTNDYPSACTPAGGCKDPGDGQRGVSVVVVNGATGYGATAAMKYAIDRGVKIVVGLVHITSQDQRNAFRLAREAGVLVLSPMLLESFQNLPVHPNMLTVDYGTKFGTAIDRFGDMIDFVTFSNNQGTYGGKNKGNTPYTAPLGFRSTDPYALSYVGAISANILALAWEGDMTAPAERFLKCLYKHGRRNGLRRIPFKAGYKISTLWANHTIGKRWLRESRYGIPDIEKTYYCLKNNEVATELPPPPITQFVAGPGILVDFLTPPRNSDMYWYVYDKVSGDVVYASYEHDMHQEGASISQLEYKMYVYQTGGYFLSHALNTANTYVVRLVDPSGRGFEHAWRFRVESRTMAESTKMWTGKRNSMMTTLKSSQLKNITSDNFRFYNASFEIVYDQATAEWKAGATVFQRIGSSPPAEAMCDDCTKGSALRCSASFIGDGVCDSGFNHPEYYFMANERRGCDMTCYSSYNARLNRCIRRDVGANARILQADGGDCTVDCQHKVFIDKELKGVGDGHCDVGYNGEPDLSCFRSRNVQDRQPMLLSQVRQQGETPFDLAGRVLNQITLDGGDCYGVADKRNTVIKGLPWSERYDRSCSIPHKSPSFGRLSLTGRYYFDHATFAATHDPVEHAECTDRTTAMTADFAARGIDSVAYYKPHTETTRAVRGSAIKTAWESDCCEQNPGACTITLGADSVNASLAQQAYMEMRCCEAHDNDGECYPKILTASSGNFVVRDVMRFSGSKLVGLRNYRLDHTENWHRFPRNRVKQTIHFPYELKSVQTVNTSLIEMQIGAPDDNDPDFYNNVTAIGVPTTSDTVKPFGMLVPLRKWDDVIEKWLSAECANDPAECFTTEDGVHAFEPAYNAPYDATSKNIKVTIEPGVTTEVNAKSFYDERFINMGPARVSTASHFERGRYIAVMCVRSWEIMTVETMVYYSCALPMGINIVDVSAPAVTSVPTPFKVVKTSDNSFEMGGVQYWAMVVGKEIFTDAATMRNGIQYKDVTALSQFTSKGVVPLNTDNMNLLKTLCTFVPKLRAFTGGNTGDTTVPYANSIAEYNSYDRPICYYDWYYTPLALTINDRSAVQSESNGNKCTMHRRNCVLFFTQDPKDLYTATTNPPSTGEYGLDVPVYLNPPRPSPRTCSVDGQDPENMFYDADCQATYVYFMQSTSTYHNLAVKFGNDVYTRGVAGLDDYGAGVVSMCACGSTSWSPECVARKGSRVRKNTWHNAAYQSCVKGTHGFDNWRKLGWNMRCETLLKKLPAQEASLSQPSCRAASENDGAILFRKYQSTSSTDFYGTGDACTSGCFFFSRSQFTTFDGAALTPPSVPPLPTMTPHVRLVTHGTLASNGCKTTITERECHTLGYRFDDTQTGGATNVNLGRMKDYFPTSQWLTAEYDMWTGLLTPTWAYPTCSYYWDDGGRILYVPSSTTSSNEPCTSSIACVCFSDTAFDLTPSPPLPPAAPPSYMGLKLIMDGSKLSDHTECLERPTKHDCQTLQSRLHNGVVHDGGLYAEMDVEFFEADGTPATFSGDSDDSTDKSAFGHLADYLTEEERAFENGWNSTYELSITVGRFRSATTPICYVTVEEWEASTYQLAGGRYTLVYNNYLDLGNTYTAEPACTVTERCVCFVHNSPPPSPPVIPPITPSPPPDPPMDPPLPPTSPPPPSPSPPRPPGAPPSPPQPPAFPPPTHQMYFIRDGTTTTTQAGCETTPSITMENLCRTLNNQLPNSAGWTSSPPPPSALTFPNYISGDKLSSGHGFTEVPQYTEDFYNKELQFNFDSSWYDAWGQERMYHMNDPTKPLCYWEHAGEGKYDAVIVYYNPGTDANTAYTCNSGKPSEGFGCICITTGFNVPVREQIFEKIDVIDANSFDLDLRHVDCLTDVTPQECFTLGNTLSPAHLGYYGAHTSISTYGHRMGSTGNVAAMAAQVNTEINVHFTTGWHVFTNFEVVDQPYHPPGCYMQADGVAFVHTIKFNTNSNYDYSYCDRTTHGGRQCMCFRGRVNSAGQPSLPPPPPSSPITSPPPEPPLVPPTPPRAPPVWNNGLLPKLVTSTNVFKAECMLPTAANKATLIELCYTWGHTVEYTPEYDPNTGADTGAAEYAVLKKARFIDTDGVTERVQDIVVSNYKWYNNNYYSSGWSSRPRGCYVGTNNGARSVLYNARSYTAGYSTYCSTSRPCVCFPLHSPPAPPMLPPSLPPPQPPSPETPPSTPPSPPTFPPSPPPPTHQMYFIRDGTTTLQAGCEDVPSTQMETLCNSLNNQLPGTASGTWTANGEKPNPVDVPEFTEDWNNRALYFNINNTKDAMGNYPTGADGLEVTITKNDPTKPLCYFEMSGEARNDDMHIFYNPGTQTGTDYGCYNGRPSEGYGCICFTSGATSPVHTRNKVFGEIKIAKSNTNLDLQTQNCLTDVTLEECRTMGNIISPAYYAYYGSKPSIWSSSGVPFGARVGQLSRNDFVNFGNQIGTTVSMHGVEGWSFHVVSKHVNSMPEVTNEADQPPGCYLEVQYAPNYVVWLKYNSNPNADFSYCDYRNNRACMCFLNRTAGLMQPPVLPPASSPPPSPPRPPLSPPPPSPPPEPPAIPPLNPSPPPIWENTPYLITSGKLSDYPECVQQSDDLAEVCYTWGHLGGGNNDMTQHYSHSCSGSTAHPCTGEAEGFTMNSMSYIDANGVAQTSNFRISTWKWYSGVWYSYSSRPAGCSTWVSWGTRYILYSAGGGSCSSTYNCICWPKP